jgi:uncharacterized membrane protein YkvA (DUF1232 family)
MTGVRDDDRDELDGFEDPDDLGPLDEVDEPVPADRAVTPPHGDRLAAAPDYAAEAEEAFDSDRVAAPPMRVLRFYDRLRRRIVRTIEKRGGRFGLGAVEALLVVPDMFVLLVRLALDPQVPAATRGLIAGSLAYFLLPFDLLPEAFVGAFGFMDDLVLAAAVLTQALGPELEPRARRYWSGRDELRVVLHDVVGAAQSLLGENLHGRLQRVLARRGIALPRPTDPRRGERAFEGFEGDPGSDLA